MQAINVQFALCNVYGLYCLFLPFEYFQKQKQTFFLVFVFPFQRNHIFHFSVDWAGIKNPSAFFKLTWLPSMGPFSDHLLWSIFYTMYIFTSQTQGFIIEVISEHHQWDILHTQSILYIIFGFITNRIRQMDIHFRLDFWWPVVNNHLCLLFVCLVGEPIK